MHLPTDGEWVLNSDDVECLALGAGILGCGGGGDPNMGRIMAQEQLKAGREIRVVNPCRCVRTCQLILSCAMSYSCECNSPPGILSPSRVDASKVGLVTCVAFMGAPAVLNEKLVSGTETLLALRTMQQVLASGVYAQEGGEGKNGNDRVAISCQTLTSGRQVWVANPEDLKKIDYNDKDIPLVSLPSSSSVASIACWTPTCEPRA